MIQIDWKKRAASQSQSLEDIEKAFLDQAYMAVQSKAAPIMKPPYRIGFEIVHHNDDNTRLVGIFVFRVNKDLYYAPVFFINGNIKGTDLFYRHSTKSFVPLTERWIEYLISLSETSEGHGVPISERTNTRRQLNLQSVVSPPDVMTLRKYASEAWEAIKATKLDDMPKESILRKFITQDGGFAAITKIANAAREDFEFAQALMLGSNPENYMPELAPYKDGLPPVPALTLHMDVMKNANVKEATADDLKKGYKFEDLREKSAINDVVYEDNDRHLQSVTSPGVYRVLVSDGTTREMICAYYSKLLRDPRENAMYHEAPSLSESILPFVIIDVENQKSKKLDLYSRQQATKVLGTFEKDIELSMGQAVPETGKMYRVYNMRAKSLSEPVYVTKVSKKDLGLTEVELQREYHSEPRTVTINPDYDNCDTVEGVLGKCCVWIAVKSDAAEGETKHYYIDDSIELGDSYALNEFVFKQGFLKAAVQKSNSDYVVRLKANEQNTPGALLTKLGTKAALMVHCALNEADADSILKAADEQGRYLFYYEPAEKKAHNLRFPQFPEFYDNMNSDYNVQEQPQPSRMMVQAERDLPYIEKHRIGDKQMFDTTDNIDTATPTSLYQMSKERGVGSLFEHGVVGSLTNTFDSAAMIDTYMPDMQTALDRIGRILFLFYWKPEDFATSFGSDDQSQLENKLVSNFKSFGDLVMELLQKNKQSQQGSVGLS